MSRQSFLTPTLVLLGGLYSLAAYGNNYDPRLTLWALESSQGIARTDLLLPFYKQSNALFFGDIQGKYGIEDQDWHGSAGLGYRKIQCNQLYGGYLFADYQETKDNSHHWVASPGIEMITNCWDGRLNGYIPLNNRHRNLGSFFPSGLNDCGIHGDCSFVEFHGHQQFEHRFLRFEEVGNGVDGEVGFNIPYFTCPSLHGGGYYYHMEDRDDVRGLTARADIPLLKGVAFTVEASYDNYEKTKLAAGFRLQWGHNSNSPCVSLCDRLYDPVIRNLARVNRGNSLPVVEGRRDEGLFLRRDNIYFFSNTGTAVVAEADAGTFENPLRNDQLNDATVAFLGPNTNLYFNPGTYVIDGTGDGRVTLQDAQSLYGRSQDFKCTVSGDDRPILEGGIDILGTSHNTLDSIRLHNIVAGPATVVALTLDDANAVHICNSEIRAEVTAAAGQNVAIGILANDSSAAIERSRITALATNTAGNNFVSGIGNFNGDFSGNTFIIEDSVVLGTAVKDADNGSLNFATGIGINVVNSTGNFLNNNFIILNSTIGGSAFVTDDNLANTTNFATAIGNNIFYNTTATTSNFSNNIFKIDSSIIDSTAFVGGDNAGLSSATGIGNNTQALIAVAVTGNGNFSDNLFDLACCEVTGSAISVGTNSGQNFATGIGNNTNMLSTIAQPVTVNSNFVDNIFNIATSEITGSAVVGLDNTENNFASGIGNNLSAISVNPSVINSNFADNIFTLLQSQISGFATTAATNSGENFATGIGNNAFGFIQITINSVFSNTFNIACCEINGSAIVGENTEINTGVGIGNNEFTPTPGVTTLNTEFTNNIFSIRNSRINATAYVVGDNSGSNTAIGVDADGSGNDIDIFNSVINVLARVDGINTGSNDAIGLFAGAGSIITIKDSLVTVTALAEGPGSNNAEATAGAGSVISDNTSFIVVE